MEVETDDEPQRDTLTFVLDVFTSIPGRDKADGGKIVAPLAYVRNSGPESPILVPKALHRFRDIVFNTSNIAIFGYPSCV